METKKINRHLYRYTAELLRSYPYDCERLRVLDEYLAAAIGPDEIRGSFTLAVQDAILERKNSSVEYRRLEFRTKTLGKVFDLLSKQDMVLVEMRFFKALPWSEIAEALHVTEDTCRRYRAPKIIARAAGMLFGDLC
jgi:DNA-directed RNA polymerase specialized sigma24 family protein